MVNGLAVARGAARRPSTGSCGHSDMMTGRVVLLGVAAAASRSYRTPHRMREPMTSPTRCAAFPRAMTRRSRAERGPLDHSGLPAAPKLKVAPIAIAPQHAGKRPASRWCDRAQTSSRVRQDLILGFDDARNGSSSSIGIRVALDSRATAE
jgi:hypothetical protein